MTTPSNYQNLGTDLDYSYVEANNPNYQSIVAAVSNRKTVMFGQQVISQTYPYPIGNLNNNMGCFSFRGIDAKTIVLLSD